MMARESFERSRRSGLYLPKEKRIAAPPPPPPPPFGLGMGLRPANKVGGLPVAGASLWLDATNPSNNNTTWLDQSGFGRNATIVNSTGTFTLTSSGINGLQCYVGSDGANSSYAVTPSYAVGPAMSAFAVYKLSAMGTTRGRQGLIDADYAAGYIMMTSFGGGSGAGTFGYVHTGPAMLVGTNLDTSPHVAALVYPDPTVPDQASWYQDSALWTTGNDTPPSSNQPRYIGNWFGILNICINGLLGEIVEFPFACSSGQLSAMNGYLTAKWL